MPDRRARVAFVVPYCGEQTYGGASSLALAVAGRMVPFYDVELLTTSATDYGTWRNAIPAGHERLGGVHVRRFAVDAARDDATFERLSRHLLTGETLSRADEESWMRAQGPYSGAMLEYLETFGDRYDAVVFFTYLYATTYFGLPLVEDRAILIPLAHDEWPLRLRLWEEFFTRPAAFVYAGEEERALVQRRFPAAPVDGPVAGVGIDAPADVSATRFRAAHHIDTPFALYLGRIDAAKGCDRLADDFRRYHRASGDPLHLVMIGERHLAITEDPAITVLGPVETATKWDALAACDAFIMPSPYESLSLALLEAWTQAKPALVNAVCETLVGQCRRAGAGLWYGDPEEFAVALATLRTPLGEHLGRKGRAYVEARYSWARVDDIYRGAIDSVLHGGR